MFLVYVGAHCSFSPSMYTNFTREIFIKHLSCGLRYSFFVCLSDYFAIQYNCVNLYKNKDREKKSQDKSI